MAIHGYNFLSSIRLTDGVWVAILLLRGFSLAEVGLAEGIFHLTGFLCEIPTGMLADLLGRRRTLFLSGVMGMLSALLMVFCQGFVGICLSMVFTSLMYNLYSGTFEAVVYDSLLMVGREGEYLRLNAQLNAVSRTISAVCCLLAGALLLMGYYVTYLMTALLCAALALCALALTEPVVTQKQQERLTRPFADLPHRFAAHVRESGHFLLIHPRACVKILADGLLAVPIYLTLMYLQQHLLDAGLSAVLLGVMLLLIKLCGTLGVMAAAKTKASLRSVICFCALCIGLGTTLIGLSASVLLCVAGAAIAAFGEGLEQPRMEADLNASFPSDQRATLLSVMSMAYSMLMIAVSPLSGAIGDALGLRAAFLFLGGMVLAALVPGVLGLRFGAKRA